MPSNFDNQFKPYVAAEDPQPELTWRAVFMGVVFGIFFGAASVYLALKAGLVVSTSIPIAVIAISLGKRLFGTSVLENNIMQTTGTAGDAIASGMIFSMVGFLFLSPDASGVSYGASFMNARTLFALAMCGALVGILLAIPLRREFAVKQHHDLQYPEGRACASVIMAGDKGGECARNAYIGVAVAFVYAFLQKIVKVIAGVPTYATSAFNRFLPAASCSVEITPEYLGMGYIIGPRNSAVMLGGGVLGWVVLIPLLATVLPQEVIAAQLVKLGELASLQTAGGPGDWNPVTRTFAELPIALYKGYVRQIGAGAVACAGFVTLLKTLPVIISSFVTSIRSLRDKAISTMQSRQDRDLSIVITMGGVLLIATLITLVPSSLGTCWMHRLILAGLVLLFGLFFVTVSARMVGIIGASSNPVSGMTIATLMGVCLLFIGIGWYGPAYEPIALAVGGIVCVIIACSGVAMQTMKCGYLVGATPKSQQIAFIVGLIVTACVASLTVMVLDKPNAAMVARGVQHMIGTSAFPAPQGTLMSTLVRGMLAFNLDWQYVVAGAFIAIAMELCRVSPLSFAVGIYLPLSTTMPLFCGGILRLFCDKQRGVNSEVSDDLGSGSLFATGLIAGGALAGVFVAMVSLNSKIWSCMEAISLQNALVAGLGTMGYNLLGLGFYLALGALVWRFAMLDKRAT